LVIEAASLADGFPERARQVSTICGGRRTKENAIASRMSQMLCPACQSPTKVLESRASEAGGAVHRRRECPRCGRRFTTYERREAEPVHVIKRDGERQRFDRNKLRAALLNAAHKRPVEPAAIEPIVGRIEAEVERSGGELSTQRIGQLCLAELRQLDPGAYLQFAGTLAEPEFAISGGSGAGSVRLGREDAELPPNTARRRGSDE
jgi:transcriptional repressor NrdR